MRNKKGKDKKYTNKISYIIKFSTVLYTQCLRYLLHKQNFFKKGGEGNLSTTRVKVVQSKAAE